jgi:hypothetical protein
LLGTKGYVVVVVVVVIQHICDARLLYSGIIAKECAF